MVKDKIDDELPGNIDFSEVEKRRAGRPLKITLTDPGDGLLYLGTKLIHWRDELPKNAMLSQLFLHYVRCDGKNADYKYDKRNPNDLLLEA